MRVFFVPKEILPEETRVAVSPETVSRLIKLGFQGMIQQDAGSLSYFSDQDYIQAGAKIVTDIRAAYAQADLVLKLHPPRALPTGSHEADLLREGSLLISFLFPHQDPALVERLAKRKVTAFSMELLPRISRAQTMDALSSQANLAGYKAVLMAADASPKMFPMMMTAAGTIKPAKVVVMGAGVAGLQAIATAKRLGAVVEVSDIRPSVKEQVQSVGGKFIEIEGAEGLEDKGGYAKEVSEDFKRKQQAVLRKHVSAADVVITTAQVPGKKAPILITEDMVKAMRSGSVIVDLAVEQGGNCEISEVGNIVVKHGVTIIGKRNVPGLLPAEASGLYSKNLLAVIQHLFPKGQYKFDPSDEITVGSVVTHAGSLVHPAVSKALEGRLQGIPFAPLAPAKETKADVPSAPPATAVAASPATTTPQVAAPPATSVPTSLASSAPAPSAPPRPASSAPAPSAPPSLGVTAPSAASPAPKPPLSPAASPSSPPSGVSAAPPISAPRPPLPTSPSAPPPRPGPFAEMAFEADEIGLDSGEKTIVRKNESGPKVPMTPEGLSSSGGANENKGSGK